MTSLGSALLDALSDDDLDALAARLAPRLSSRLGGAEASGWLSTAAASAYTGMPPSRLHDLTATGRLHPARDGRALRFRRSELTEYLEHRT